MITWLTATPFLALPGVLVFFTGLLPMVELYGQPVGGGLVRQWCVNHLVLPVLPAFDTQRVVDWYMQTDAAGELLLHALIVLNMNALLLPVLYPLAVGFIRLNNWVAKTNLDEKRRSVKR